jgi:L-threonylcarbamoyladenylate synthase
VGNVVKADAAGIRAAAEALRAGKLVAFPTETVYGLGADATNGQAVAQVFAAKGRPRFNPLIVHSDLVTGGLDTLAVRAPDHPVARALLQEVGRPLAAPSANRSGHVSPTQAGHVAADLGDKVAMILDGGATAHGLESTIIDARGDLPILLRPGAIPAETIAAVLGDKVVRAHVEDNARPSAPGQLASHYAPQAHVRLDVQHVRPGEALLAFGQPVLPTEGPVINLSPSGDLTEAAANLFAALRALDAAGATAIAVMPIPEQGLGEAINDRLRRAAAPR